jgi:ligand-binding sensor domain-containing protein
MIKYIGVIILLAISTLALNGSVNYIPLGSNPLFESWRWKTFSELGDKGIRCIEEGKDQSVWFGTAKGVFHYDGLIWINYFDENEVLKAPVYSLCYTSSDKLYAISTKGICHFSKGTWTTDMLFPKTGVLGNEWEILNMIESATGEIWVGLHFGLVRIINNKVTIFATRSQLNTLTETFHEIDIQDVSGIYNGIESFIVYDIMEDRSGNLWLGLEDGRTIRLFNKNHSIKSPGNYILYSEADGMVLSRLPILYESKTGEIYNISQSVGGAVNIFDPVTEVWKNHALSEDFGGDNINFSICETSDGALWIGGFSRIFVRQKDAWYEYKQPLVQIPATRVIFYPASDGSLWMIGHQADVIRIEYQTSLWATYKDLLFQCESRDGTQWFINGEGKVIYFTPSTTEWKMLEDEFPMSDPIRIFIDRSGVLWAAGSDQGVAALAWNSTGSWILKSFPELCWGFHSNGIFQSKDNSMWFGANADCGDASWGIVRYSPVKGSMYDENAWHIYTGTQVCEVAYALAETEKNSLLCGNYKGLFEYDGSQVRELHQVLLGDIIKVEGMVQDPVKGVWIGTRSQGVIHYIDDDNWQQYTVENGLASNTVSSLIFSEDSTLWVATDKGISRFDGKKWNKHALPDYFKIIRGNGTLEKGSNNSIWINISTIDWYRRVFYKKEFTPINSPLISYKIQPELVAPETNITKCDKRVYYPGNTMIAWQGVDRWDDTKPSELQYSYKMDDDPWSDFTTETNHTFLSMRRGWHKIQVRARDNFMNVDPEPAFAEFKSIPPIWGQVWFLLLMAGFVAAIAYLYSASYKKNREMEAQNMIMKQKNEDLVNQQAEIEQKGKQIMELLEKERESHWFNEGVIAINEVIKANRDSLEKLSHGLVVKLVEYLGAQSAGIMLLQKEAGERGEGYLELVSAYGYNKERLSSKKVMLEEGLVGACFREKKTMKFNNVPESYFVESGMGKARIVELVLVPLKLHDEIIGILEISSFRKIDEKKIKLLEIVSENVASNLISLEAKSRIEKLYRQSQEDTARLHEQEEELHQQMEELHATQEESQRREQQLLATLEEYKKKSSKHKKE